MRFVWDAKKNLLNKAKHRVSFETAQKVFDDPLHLSIQDRHIEGEERWQTLGVVEGVVLLLVAHTVSTNSDKETIRIISARKATRRERAQYEQEI
ncbi:BrnT family toxin [Geoalkalibacter halelectricus]|uniref:BrnT family toxin n=1 Tax=Geoalkalibacter halelectricus TaxID=2847045 RepID=A0ABY5ZME9_9BACT|nr:BrnT family toxin [Geoalkalibacter halelectricus]MDO3378370.1 BrnT family toxin [Geoalkalibacter halelectricus]UWZ80310.1 BrnT family toxin [Geoalkalibacter halelectricus]